MIRPEPQSKRKIPPNPRKFVPLREILTYYRGQCARFARILLAFFRRNRHISVPVPPQAGTKRILLVSSHMSTFSEHIQTGLMVTVPLGISAYIVVTLQDFYTVAVLVVPYLVLVYCVFTFYYYSKRELVITDEGLYLRWHCTKFREQYKVLSRTLPFAQIDKIVVRKSRDQHRITDIYVIGQHRNTIAYDVEKPVTQLAKEPPPRRTIIHIPGRLPEAYAILTLFYRGFPDKIVDAKPDKVTAAKSSRPATPPVSPPAPALPPVPPPLADG